MPTEIPTIQEAQQALATLQRFLGAMSTMFGQASDKPPAKTARLELSAKPATVKTYVRRSGKLTWKQKVSAIINDAGRAVPPKYITDEYEERFGWDGKRSVLGNRIRSTLALMKKDGDVSVTTSGNYALPKAAEGS